MAVKDRERVRAIDESLRRLSLVAEGVRACVVFGAEGLPLASYPQDGAELAALSARLAGMAQRSLERLGQGNLGRLLLEGEYGTLLCCPAGEAYLALLIERDSSLVHALFAARKAADEIAAALAEG